MSDVKPRVVTNFLHEISMGETSQNWLRKRWIFFVFGYFYLPFGLGVCSDGLILLLVTISCYGRPSFSLSRWVSFVLHVCVQCWGWFSVLYGGIYVRTILSSSIRCFLTDPWIAQHKKNMQENSWDEIFSNRRICQM